jgi:hypothetical protein
MKLLLTETIGKYRLLAVTLFVFATVMPLYAQTATGLYAALTGAVTSRPDELVGNGAVGGQVGFRMNPGWFFFGEYLYAGKDFYYPDGSDWKMAASWRDVPSGSASRGDWVFYRERHAVGLGGGLSGAVGPVGLFGAAGLMFNIVSLSDAADYYPEFQEAATTSSIGDSTVLFSTTLRAGVVWPPDSPFAGHGAVMVQLEPSDQAGDEGYLQRNTYFIFGVVFQTGPLMNGGGL